MSAHNKKGVVAAQSTGIVVGDGKHHRQRLKLHLKLWGVICFALLLCIAVGIGVWHFAKDNHQAQSTRQSATNDNQKPATQAPKVDVSTLTPEEKYHYLASTGNYAGAEQVLEGQLAGADNPQAKAEIYLQQAYVAVQFKRYNDANSYANKALQLDNGSSGPYVALSSIAQAQGDIAKAKTYMQEAISHLNKDAPQYDLQLRNYERQLEGIGK